MVIILSKLLQLNKYKSINQDLRDILNMSYHILKATLTQESAKVNVNASLVLYCVSGKFTQALSVS